MRVRLGTGLVVALCTVGLAACGGGERQDENEPEGEFPVEIASADFPASQRLAQTSDLTLEIRNAGEETIPDLAVTVFTQAEESVADVDAADAEASEADDARRSTTRARRSPRASSTRRSTRRSTRSSMRPRPRRRTRTPMQATPSRDELNEADEPRSQAAGPFSVLSEQEGLAIPSRPVWILEQGYPREENAADNTPPPARSRAAAEPRPHRPTPSASGARGRRPAPIVWRVTPVQAGDYSVLYRVAAGLQGNAVAVNEDGSVPEGEFIT